MTKADIVDRIASATGMTKLETDAVVDGFLKTVGAARADGERIELRDFGVLDMNLKSGKAKNGAAIKTVKSPRKGANA